MSNYIKLCCTTFRANLYCCTLLYPLHYPHSAMVGPSVTISHNVFPTARGPVGRDGQGVAMKMLNDEETEINFHYPTSVAINFRV